MGSNGFQKRSKWVKNSKEFKMGSSEMNKFKLRNVLISREILFRCAKSAILKYLQALNLNFHEFLHY